MTNLHVLTPDDWRLWQDVRLAALADAPGAFGSTLADWESADEARWRRRLEAVALNLVAEIDDRPVGQVGGTAVGDDGRVELISMWVAPEARRTGAAEALVEEVSGWARRAGAVAVRLSVRRDNERALRLYRRTGFVSVDEPGDEEAEVAMVRSLE